MRVGGAKLCELAAIYDVTETTVSRICLNHIWKIDESPLRINLSVKITPPMRDDIRRRRAGGEGAASIAADLGVDRTSIYNVLKSVE